MSRKTPGEVRARTCGTKSPSRSEALHFIDSSKSPSTWGFVDGDLDESIKRSASDRLGDLVPQVRARTSPGVFRDMALLGLCLELSSFFAHFFVLYSLLKTEQKKTLNTPSTNRHTLEISTRYWTYPSASFRLRATSKTVRHAFRQYTVFLLSTYRSSIVLDPECVAWQCPVTVQMFACSTFVVFVAETSLVQLAKKRHVRYLQPRSCWAMSAATVHPSHRTCGADRILTESDRPIGNNASKPEYNFIRGAVAQIKHSRIRNTLAYDFQRIKV